MLLEELASHRPESSRPLTSSSKVRILIHEAEIAEHELSE